VWPPFWRDFEGAVAPNVGQQLWDPSIFPHVLERLGDEIRQRVKSARHLWESLLALRLQLGQDSQHSKSKAVRIVPQLALHIDCGLGFTVSTGLTIEDPKNNTSYILLLGKIKNHMHVIYIIIHNLYITA